MVVDDDAFSMEINAAVMFLVHASPLDLAVGEDGGGAAADGMEIERRWYGGRGDGAGAGA